MKALDWLGRHEAFAFAPSLGTAHKAEAKPLQPEAAYVLQFAANASDIVEAQRLHYKVFAEEMGATLPSGASGHDIDEFDAHCEHLLVREAGTGRVVGCYRLLPPENARRIGRFYSESEFDLSRIAHADFVFVQHARDRARGAGRRNCHFPAAGANRAGDHLQLALRRQLGLLQVVFVDEAAGEMGHRIVDRTHVEAFHQFRLESETDRKLGRAAADIDHQLAQAWLGRTMGDTRKNQPRLFAAGDDLNRKTQHLFSTPDEFAGVLGNAQGVGSDHANTFRVEAAQALGELAQCLEPARLCVVAEHFVLRQPGGKARVVAH